jgi:hypothetical protein
VQFIDFGGGGGGYLYPLDKRGEDNFPQGYISHFKEISLLFVWV